VKFPWSTHRGRSLQGAPVRNLQSMPSTRERVTSVTRIPVATISALIFPHFESDKALRTISYPQETSLQKVEGAFSVPQAKVAKSPPFYSLLPNFRGLAKTNL
jgi:hypothetical protein